MEKSHFQWTKFLGAGHVRCSRSMVCLSPSPRLYCIFWTAIRFSTFEFCGRSGRASKPYVAVLCSDEQPVRVRKGVIVRRLTTSGSECQPYIFSMCPAVFCTFLQPVCMGTVTDHHDPWTRYEFLVLPTPERNRKAARRSQAAVPDGIRAFTVFVSSPFLVAARFLGLL
jgi:hypothetical protein